MLKRIMLAVGLMLAGAVHADVIAKGSATDKAVAKALNATTDYASIAVSETGKVVAGIVKDVTATLKDAKDFVLDQAPKVIKEFMVWRMTQCAFWAVVGLFLTVLVLFASWRLVKNSKPGDEERAFAGLMRWALAPLLFLAFVGPNVYEMLYIYLAPRVYLIENVAYLIKYGTIQP